MSVNSKMTGIANKIRSLLGITGKLGLDAMSTNLETANTEVTTQEELMEQIIDALEGKSVGVGTAKEEQEKSVDITENGTTEVLPDEGKVLSKVTVNVDVQSGGVDNVVFASSVRFEDLNLFNKENVVVHLDNIKALEYVFNQTVVNTTVKVLEVHCKPIVDTIVNCFTAYLANAENALQKVILYIDTSKCTNFNGVFWKQVNLEEVTGTPLDFTSAISCNMIFNNCTKLKEIRFKENTISCNAPFNGSNAFSNETIESIINGLVDLSGSTSKTLTLSDGIKAKLTNEQLATITGKNWTLA